jgi:tripartite-type tricarboxylate transporter receptor subunit TctC
MNERMIRRLGATLLATGAAAALTAGAQDFPTHAVRMVVPYGPGGVTDIVARVVAPGIADDLGQQVVVENRAGGAAIPGFDFVAKSKPDGYTIVAATTALAAQPILFRKLPYQAEKDFTPISLMIQVPTILVVHPSLPTRNVKEFIALAKARPGVLNYASAGNGTDSHLTAEMFKSAAKIDAVHVPYKAGNMVMLDLIAGQVAFVFSPIPTAQPFIETGRMRAIGVTSLKRTAAYPDVQTVAETIPGFSLYAWIGLFGPAGVPASVVTRLNAATSKALARPDISKRLAVIAAEIVGGPPSQMATHLRTETDRWAKLAKEVKFEVAD